MKRLLLLVTLLLVPALAYATCGPSVVSDLIVHNGRTSVAFAWTAPYANCTSGGAASEYSVRYSSSPITEQNFWSATPITDAPSVPNSPGGSECGDLMTSQGTTYYVALKAKDASGNWSPLSNVITFTTPTSGASTTC